VLTIGIYRKTAIVIVKGRIKMVVILLKSGGVRFRQHSLYERSAANVDDVNRFQPYTKVGAAGRFNSDRRACQSIVCMVSSG